MLNVRSRARVGTGWFVRDERGQMAFLMALSVLVVFAFFGLSFDAGSWYLAHAWTQSQVDAAAQAAALELPNVGAARATAGGWLDRNGIAAPVDYQCADVTPGGGPEWFAVTDEVPNGAPDGEPDRVVVCLQRTVPAAFAGLAGVNTVTVSARAKARIAVEPARFAVMVMDPDACEAFRVGGNAVVTIVDTTGMGQGGSTFTASNATCGQGALHVIGSGVLRGVSHEVNGSVNACVGCIDPPATSPAPLFVDPWLSLPVPSVPSGACLTGTGGGSGGTSFTSGSHVLVPGKYCSDIRVSGGADVTVRPGVYVLVDAEVTISPSAGGFFCGRASGTAVCTSADDAAGANGTVFYSTCDPSPCSGGETAGEVDFGGGGGDVRLRGHASYDNIVIWIDRQSNGGAPSSTEIRIVGNSTTKLEGHVYAASSDADFSGGSSGTPETLNISALVNTMNFAGGSNLELRWDPVTAPKYRRVALVE